MTGVPCCKKYELKRLTRSTDARLPRAHVRGGLEVTTLVIVVRIAPKFQRIVHICMNV